MTVTRTTTPTTTTPTAPNRPAAYHRQSPHQADHRPRAFRAPPQRPPWLCSAPRVPDLKLREEEAPAKDQDQETDLPPPQCAWRHDLQSAACQQSAMQCIRDWLVWPRGYLYTTPLTIKGPSFSSFPRRVFTLFTMAALPPTLINHDLTDTGRRAWRSQRHRSSRERPSTARPRSRRPAPGGAPGCQRARGPVRRP